MDMSILAEILRRRKMKGDDEISKVLSTLESDSGDDIKEVKEISFGDVDMKKYDRNADASGESTDELAPSKQEADKNNPEIKKDVDDEKEKFKAALKKEVKPFSKGKSGFGDDDSDEEADGSVFSEKDYKYAKGRKESGGKLGLFDRVQLNIAKRMKK